MATKKYIFSDSEEGHDVKEELQYMAEDVSYTTTTSYTPDIIHYPDNLISFVDRHMAYLSNHPNVETNKYIANLKLMTRVRTSHNLFLDT